MKKNLKSFILAISILCGRSVQANNLQDALVVASVLATTGIACVGLYKLISYAYYYNIDRTPTSVFLADLEFETERMHPFLQDYFSYLNTPLNLPIIIIKRCPQAYYPTLDYYDALSEHLYSLESIFTALQRKKDKQTSDISSTTLEEALTNLYILIRNVEKYRTVIEKSKAYNIEIRAKYPLEPIIQTITINRHN
jgi:hypothetical protein